MAQFDESKIINPLHPEKASIGMKYWYSDRLLELKRQVEENTKDYIGKLDRVSDTGYCPFEIRNDNRWQYLYPYEEPSKQRMTNIQFMEWLAKCNGIFKHKNHGSCFNWITCLEDVLNEEVDEDIVIRSWDSEEWVEPTVDIYERDCKGGKE